MSNQLDEKWLITGSSDSSVVGAPDSCQKGLGFESPPERQESFLLHVKLSVLILISVSVPPPVVLRQHVKDPGHSAKSSCGRLQLNTHAPNHVAQYEVTLETDAWLYGVHRTCAKMAAVSYGIRPVMQQPNSTVSTPLPWILIKKHYLKNDISFMYDNSRVSLFKS